jgi:hypothetical protein
MIEPTPALRGIIDQIRSDYDYSYAEVAYTADGREAWLIREDIIIKVQDSGKIQINTLVDWIQVPSFVVPKPSEPEPIGNMRAHALRAFPVPENKIPHLLPSEITEVRNWARAQGMPVPDGLPSVTPELVTAYYLRKD